MSTSFEDLPWREAVERYGDAWEALLREQDLSPTLHPTWIESISASLGIAGRLRCLVHTVAGSLEGVAPYTLERARISGWPVRLLTLGSCVLSYHNELICRGEPDVLLRALLDDHAPGHWTTFEAANILSTSPTARALRRLAPELGAVLVEYPGERSPTLQIDTDWQGLLASKRKKFRYKLKRRRSHLEKSGQVRERWIREEQDVDELLRCMLAIESASWKVDASMAVLGGTPEERYYRRLLPWMARSGILLANILHLDDEPIAYSLCYEWNGRIGQLKTSFSQPHGELSPGAVVVEDGIRFAMDNGAKEFDFLGDIMPHKMEWANYVRPHAGMFLFGNSLPVRALGHLKRLRRRRAAEPDTAVQAPA